MKILQNKKPIVVGIALAVFMTLSLVFTYMITSKGVLTEAATDTAFETSIAAFPESYKPYLRTLHASYPNWKFVAFDTGLDWNVVLKNEMVLSRNLVPNTTMYLMGKSFTMPTAWKSTTVSGAYSWSANDWVILSAPYWVQASSEIVQYVMDPRNWLNENNIFEFEVLSYNSVYQTEAILKTMMDDTFMDCDYAKVGGTTKTYAQVLIEAAAKYNVSPIHLCARIIQEKGRGTYNSTTKKYVLTDTLAAGVSTKNGTTFYKSTSTDTVIYYNFFNINASGTTTAEIINNGGAEAKSKGWTTQYLAIMGGASKITNEYIGIGQDTIYFQKFSVVNPTYYYWKQYMQNLFAPVNEGYSTKNTYSEAGVMNTAFTFRIPVYSNMPTTAYPEPDRTNTGNPNYKLSALTVSGTNVGGTAATVALTPSFSTDTTSYSISVPYKVESITIGAKAYASTSTITGTGTKALKVGTNTFKVVCKSEYGTSRTYTITVTRPEGSTYISALKTDSGYWDASFNKDTSSYKTCIPFSKTSLKFIFTTESTIARVVMRVGSTTTEVSTGSGSVTVTPPTGKTIYYFDVYPSVNDTSEKRTYAVTVYRYTDTTYSLSSFQISGTESKYILETRYINGFVIGDTIANVIKKLAVTNGTVKVVSANGDFTSTALSTSTLISTGQIIYLVDANGNAIQKMRVVLYGDVNGDGKVDLFDYAYIKKHYWIKAFITGINLKAADVNPSSSGVDLFDMAAMKKYLWLDGSISQTR